MSVPLVLALGVVGAAIGFAADRLGARWPAHEDGSVRPIDWRTAALVVVGAVALGALPMRWDQPLEILILAVYFAALIVLMATDLDAKLLPDIVTIPLAIAAFALFLIQVNPLLAGKEWFTGPVAALGAPALLAGTSLLLRGGIGMGDLKLAVGLGMMSGIGRLFSGFLFASAASSVLIIGLVALRRIGLRTAIPFGPVLIVGGMIAALLP